MERTITSKDMPFYLDNENWPQGKGPRQPAVSDEALDPSSQVEYPPPLHPVTEAVEPDAAGASRSVLHPVEDPPPSPYDDDKAHAVEDFAGRIASVVEGDYGDWMRRANTYWWELVEALGATSTDVRKLLFEMHNLIQYNPDFRLIETRRQVIEMASRLREMLGAKEPLDLHQFNISLTAHTAQPAVPPFSLRLDEPEPLDIGAWVDGGNDLSINGELGGSHTVQI